MSAWQHWLNRLTSGNLFSGDFPKGLPLPEYKYLSNHDGRIQTPPLYKHYYISLLQRDGQYAVPCVAVGDKVGAGDIIARPTNDAALFCHAPTSGRVTAIVDICETHASAMTVKALQITADGYDTPSTALPPLPQSAWQDRQQLLTRILHAGIAGMGGAGFPAEKKIKSAQTVETLIINAAECEPYITCDDLLMRHEAEAILRGAQLFAQMLSAKHILLGIEDNKPEAITALQTAAAAVNDKRIEIHVLPTQYPMGSRYQIAHALLGRKPDVSKRAYQSGFVCHNVATAKAVYDAVAHGKASIERLVTFSGDALAHPGVYRCKVGTTLADIGTTVGLPADCPEVIFGGTMMGFPAQAQQLLPQVIKRETTSVLAFQHPPEHSAKAAQNCIRCGDCAEVCPMDLLPQQLQFYGRSGDHSSAEANRLFDCIECGLCAYVCPSDIALVNIFQHSKGEILNARRKKAEAEHARQRFETHNARLATAKAERAAKAAARYAKLQGKSTATPLVDKSPADSLDKAKHKPADKHDLIAAALTRTQAKQAERQAQNQSSTTIENTTAGQKTAASVDGQDLIAAALARAQAKKAERQAQTANQPADSAKHHDNIKT